MLVLFDIDATLLTTSRAGVLAIGDAGRDLYGPDFREDLVEYAGGLDPVLMKQLLIHHGLPHDAPEIARFRAAYGERLRGRLAEPGMARPLPGVVDILDELARFQEVTIGLLTGNFPETGAVKLAAAGLDVERFPVRAWGCDSPHEPALREHLTPVAMANYFRHQRCEVAPDRVTIIGDTIHDVRCATAHGCRSIGVATGKYGVDELAAAGADLAVQDLSDTQGILAWLTRMDIAPHRR